MTLCVSTAQVWLCGGSVEVVPCSRIAHIERAHKPYAPDLNSAMRRNALRVADIWLDDYAYSLPGTFHLRLTQRFMIHEIISTMCVCIVCTIHERLKHYIFIFIDIVSNDMFSLLCHTSTA